MTMSLGIFDKFKGFLECLKCWLLGAHCSDYIDIDVEISFFSQEYERYNTIHTAYHSVLHKKAYD